MDKQQKLDYWDAQASLAQVLVPEHVARIQISDDNGPEMWPVTAEAIMNKLQLKWSNSGGNAHHSSKWTALYHAIMRLPK